jgi:RNA polymerase sigma-70 factor, ECF subfamily
MESDILLIKGRQATDIADFDKIVDLHRKRVYQLAYQLTGSHEDADDISQEVFIRAYRSIAKFRGGSKLSTWLYRIAVNLSINHLKKKSRRSHELPNEEVLNTSFDSLVSDWTNPLEDVEAKELAQQIKEATESLPVAEKVVFAMAVQQGLSYKEIARTLDCPIGTVMSRLNRARRRLRDKLKDYVI